jgi:hypothetical protein
VEESAYVGLDPRRRFGRRPPDRRRDGRRNHRDDELLQACRFYARDRAARTPEDVPRGRVGRVVSILERAEAEVKESWLGEFGSTLQ